MKRINKKYPSKLLLFGEHIIIKGANALAIPFPNFSGTWQYLNANDSLEKQQSLHQFANYLKEHLFRTIDIDLFQNELKKGLYFDSNIPKGYGVGSSGALVAATFDSLKKTDLNFSKRELRDILAKMESFFHGSSSGTDPLICYLNKAILLKGRTEIEAVQIQNFNKENDWTLFLLDTKIPRQTAPFVNIFLKKCAHASFMNLIESELFPLNSDAIKKFLAGNWTKVFEVWHQISEFQMLHFQEMIPSGFKGIWREGVDNNNFKLKLCGAGGGGFILGITENFEETTVILNNQNLLRISF